MDCIKGHFCAILSPETGSMQNVQETIVSFEKKCFALWQHGHQLPISSWHFCDMAFSAGNARNSSKDDSSRGVLGTLPVLNIPDLISFVRQPCEGDSHDPQFEYA